MFKEASLTLTAWYLGLLMLLSLSFSGAFYRISIDEVSRGLNRQEGAMRLQNLPPGLFPGVDAIIQARQEQLDETRAHIMWNLAFFNLTILVCGGVLSYWLARRTLQPIEDALEAQQRFTADASHELRTPLTAMRTELEVSLRDTALTLEESKRLHTSILEEVQRLERLSSSLLKLSAADRAHDAAGAERVRLDEQVRRAAEKLQPVATAAGVSLEYSDVAEAVVRGDAQSLFELAVILIENAIKYSPSGTTVTVGIARDGRRAIFTVKDQGIGIKASDLPHIFERFYRADTSRSKQGVEGYGLGLAIAKRIVETYGGSIQVASIPDHGTTFTVAIPVAQP